MVLRDEEAHHALHVVRVKAGDAIEVFDGTGNAWVCRVGEATRKDVTCEVVSHRIEEEETPRVVVSAAWLNKDKAVEELIQRCTELGVAEFRFFRGAHSGKAPKVSDKWTKWAIESCKQCGRLRLPTFEVADGVSDVIRDDETTNLAHLGEECVPLKECLGAGEDVNIVIGPEGDFSDAEIAELMARGAQAVSLGSATYRSQVAASVLSGLVMYELGRLS